MTKSYADLFREAQAEVREVTPQQADALRADPATLFVDVREADEWAHGHIPGAVLVPKSHLEEEIEAKAPDRARPVVLYCAGGVRSIFAARTLQEMGYTAAVSMSGGFDEWNALGLPSVRPPGLTAGAAAALQPPPPDAGGGARGAGDAPALEGAARRALAGSGRRPPSTWRPPGSGRSGSSTSTSWTSATSSARSSTRRTGWV